MITMKPIVFKRLNLSVRGINLMAKVYVVKGIMYHLG
jgi:hypothetical protein